MSGSLLLRKQLILNYVNFLACILLAFNWIKNNQVLSQLTHAYYRDTVPLSAWKARSWSIWGGGGRRWGLKHFCL